MTRPAKILMQAVGGTLDAIVSGPVWRPGVHTTPQNADDLQCERMFVALHSARHDAWHLAAAARALRQPLTALAGAHASASARRPPADARRLTTLSDVVANGMARPA